MHSKSHVETRSTLKLTQKFISACRTQPTVDRHTLFSNIFNMGKETIDTMEFFGMAKISTSVAFLEKQLQSMEHLDFQTFIHDTLQKLISTYCPNRTVTTELFILDEEDTFGREKLNGVSAFTEYDGKLTFIVYPEEKVRLVLESVIAHEFHHFWRIGLLNITEKNETLLDRLVLEGLAEHFVGVVLGSERQGPFIKALTEEQAKDYWEKDFTDQLNFKGEATNPWMFGGKNGLPLWAGYSMGYHLVQWYLQHHPNQSIEDLTKLPSVAFLR